jgi:hypothetical protein
MSIRSEAAVHVPKVLAIVEETKRMRHKQGAPLLSLTCSVWGSANVPSRLAASCYASFSAYGLPRAQ